jgi:hypothetical protein
MVAGSPSQTAPVAHEIGAARRPLEDYSFRGRMSHLGLSVAKVCKIVNLTLHEWSRDRYGTVRLLGSACVVNPDYLILPTA